MSDGEPRRRKTKGRQIPGEQYLSRRAESPHWQISFRIEGHRFRASSGTADRLDAARLADAQWRAAWRQINLGETTPDELTLNEACTRYWTEVASGTEYGKRSQRYNMRVLLRAIGRETLLSQLDDQRINDAVQWLRSRKPARKGQPESISNATVNRYLTTLSVICRRASKLWGVRVGTWTKSEHALREAEGREIFLEYDQARGLLAAAKGHLRPILLLELTTGLRLRNVLGLTWERVSLDMNRIVLVQKGGRPLSVNLPPAAVQVLQAIEPDPDKQSGPVLTYGNRNLRCSCPRCRNPRYAGQPMRSVRRAFATALKQAGLDKLPARVRWHDLRHTFASYLLAESGDITLVQKALGHRSITTTVRYAHLLAGRKEAAIGAVADKLLQTQEQPQKTAENRKRLAQTSR